MSRYGKVVSVRLNTKNALQQAFVEFETADSVSPFYDEWGFICLKHFIKAIPLALPQDQWELRSKYGVSAGKKDQIDKKFFFEIINVLDQMIKSTSILLRNFFLKKISIWSLFPALTPYGQITSKSISNKTAIIEYWIISQPKTDNNGQIIIHQ